MVVEVTPNQQTHRVIMPRVVEEVPEVEGIMHTIQSVGMVEMG